MLPTFFGLNTVTRALLAQQEAVDVLNQNISNVNTPGYSRQDPIVQATDPYTMVAFNRPALAGQLGTGSQVSLINRFQDELLNSQIRFATQSVGQLQEMDDHFSQIQAIFNDPSNVALNAAASAFFDAIHDLSNNPESAPARQSVQETGSTLAHAVTNRYSQLTTLQSDLNTKVVSIVADINSDIRQIAALNSAIAQSQGIGDNANDLKDRRDLLVDKLSNLVDIRDVKNPDGTDTVQMNGRFLVNKDQAYTLTTLTDANSTALVKPVKVFWQEDVTKFENLNPGYDPISGLNITTNAPLVPPQTVAPAIITTGSLDGALNIRDNIIQNTLLPQLNELSDALTNTQVLSLNTGLKATQLLSGSVSIPDDFTVTVLTPQNTPSPPGPGQQVTFSVGSAQAPAAQVVGTNSSAVTDATALTAGDTITVTGPGGSFTFTATAGKTVGDLRAAINGAGINVSATVNAAGQVQFTPTVAGGVQVSNVSGSIFSTLGFHEGTVQGVVDAINSSSVSPFVHASLNSTGQLQIDSISQGALVKVDLANGAASKDFGFSSSVADGFNLVHVQGFGLTTPAQWAGGVAGLTLPAGLATGDGLRVTGPDGATVDVVLPPPSTASAQSALLVNGASIAAAGAVNTSGNPVVPAQLGFLVSGAGGGGTFTINGTDADGNAASENLTVSGNGTFTTRQVFKTITSVTTTAFGAGAQLSVTAPDVQPTVADLINVINAHNRTDTQVVGTQNGLLPGTALAAGSGNFVLTVVTPTGQTVTFNPVNATPAPATVQDVLDAINQTGKYVTSSNGVSPYVHASLDNTGRLMIDATAPGTLLKVDQANAATATQFGFQTGVLQSPIGQVHGFQAALDAQGRLVIASQPTNFGQSGQVANLQAQAVGNIVAANTFASAGSITIAGPNGNQTFSITAGTTVAAFINTVNAASLGVTAQINSNGHFQLFTQQTGPSAKIQITGVSGSVTSTMGITNGSFTGTNHGFPPSASITVAKIPNSTGPNVTFNDFYGTPTVSTNSNQFFFQGATQSLANQVVASKAANGAASFTQLASPGSLSVSIQGESVFGGTITIQGIDATTGQAVAGGETLTFDANGVITTSHTFKSITSITGAGFTSGQLQVVANLAGTQKDTASSFAVDGNVLNDTSLIAAARVPGAPGDAFNALALLNVQQQAIVSNGQFAATFGDFYSGVTENLGASAQQTHTNMVSQQQLVQHLTNQKQSVVGVNLDEEAAHLVALQHAYQAAARAITTQDSMLDTIINGMGLVGRS